MATLADLDHVALTLQAALGSDEQEVLQASHAADAILTQPTISFPDVCMWWTSNGKTVRKWLGKLRSNFFLKLVSLVAGFIKSLADLGEKLANILDKVCGVDTTK